MTKALTEVYAVGSILPHRSWSKIRFLWVTAVALLRKGEGLAQSFGPIQYSSGLWPYNETSAHMNLLALALGS